MSIHIYMPAIGAGTTQGSIVQWNVAPGDWIQEGEIIAEIETDKAVIALEAVDSGRLESILVQAGEPNVAVGAPIALLSGAAGTTEAGAAPADVAEADVAEAGAVEECAVEPDDPVRRLLASPAARHIARSLDIDLKQIKGSGPNGRIVKYDVQQVIEAKAIEAKAGAKADVASKMAHPAADRPANGAAGGANAPAAAPANLAAHTPMRRTIAKRLSESKREAPHFYLEVECRMDKLIKLRQKINEATDFKYSLNDLLCYAISRAFKNNPVVNSQWQEEGMYQRPTLDLNVAVATEAGLITPLLRRCDQLSLSEMAREIRLLAESAKQGRLKPDQYESGGLTVTNLGMYGITRFSAIINPPQSAIVALGAVEQRPIVIKDKVKAGAVISITLSADHRVVDGAVAARFMGDIKNRIENPINLIL